MKFVFQELSVLPVASSLACKKNGGAPGAHCLRMHLISPRCGESGLFSDSSVLCDVRARTRYSILVKIIMVCNESPDFQQAISHPLQRLVTPGMVLKTEQRALSKLSTLPLHFAHQIR